jgi:hypothetical protein
MQIANTLFFAWMSDQGLDCARALGSRREINILEQRQFSRSRRSRISRELREHPINCEECEGAPPKKMADRARMHNQTQHPEHQ